MQRAGPESSGPRAFDPLLAPDRGVNPGPRPEIRVRAYRRHDLPRLYELDQSCFPPDIAYSRADLRYFLASPRCFCWVAESPSDSVAGFIIVERVRRSGSMTGHIVTIDVGAQMRRQGVGRLLMETAEEQLTREGAILMSLEVAEDNLPAQVFYRRLGFAEVGRIPKYYAARQDARVMEKRL
ncbi:MAG TPA: N-acetyltransferase [Acidobacteriaceae bacterium]|nr:N-acetyltransferase [Acidobacteriaceae bacterium]